MTLAEKHCNACINAKRSLSPEEFRDFLPQIKNWELIENKKIVKIFQLKNFAEALALANRIGEIAEEEGHHPDLLVRWGSLEVTLWTHKVGGLTEADFVMAAKIDRLL